MANAQPGRPTKYEPSMPERAFRFSLLGMTNEQIEAALGIGHATYVEWRQRYPEFDDAILRGKHEADAHVAHSLYRRAVGYEHKVTRLFMHEGHVIEHDVTERFEPDVQAATKWLFNRRPDLWRAVKEPEGGSDEAPPPVKVEIIVKDGRTRAEPEPAAG